MGVESVLTANCTLAVVVELVLDEPEHQARLAHGRLAEQDELELKHAWISLGSSHICGGKGTLSATDRLYQSKRAEARMCHSKVPDCAMKVVPETTLSLTTWVDMPAGQVQGVATRHERVRRCSCSSWCLRRQTVDNALMNESTGGGDGDGGAAKGGMVQTMQTLKLSNKASAVDEGWGCGVDAEGSSQERERV